MRGEKQRKIGDSRVLSVERVGGFVVKKLESELPDGAIEPGSEEAHRIIEGVAKKHSQARTYKITLKPERSTNLKRNT